jgi:hypothetical protein
MRKVAITAVTVGVAGMAALLAALLLTPVDPFSQYEFISSEKDPGSNQHAVTFKVHHSDSSTIAFATWISPGPVLADYRAVPSQGLTMVWRGLPNAKPAWVDGRLTMTVQADTERRRDSFSACYFEYDSNPIICFNSTLVSVVSP